MPLVIALTLGLLAGQPAVFAQLQVDMPPEQAKQLEDFAREVMVFSGEITVSGSPLIAPLAQKLADAFMAIHDKTKITITTSSSDEGLKEIVDGTAQVALMSRFLRENEYKEHPDLKGYTIGSLAMAIIVHPDNPVESLSLEQIRDIYTGDIKTWKQFGGPDKPIDLIVLDQGADLRYLFDDTFLEGGKTKTPKKTTTSVKNPESLRAQVATNPNAIGYIMLQTIDASVRAVPVNKIEPTYENASTGLYPLLFQMTLLTKDMPVDVAREWILYIITDGQEIVATEQFVRSD